MNTARAWMPGAIWSSIHIFLIYYEPRHSVHTRAVLAARSLVFKAELLGPMAEAMLRFVYTTPEMVQHLLVAVDRFALDRHNLMCP